MTKDEALPFGVGGGLVAIKTLLSRDPCVHANTAIEMIDAILSAHAQPAPVQEHEPENEPYVSLASVQEPVGIKGYAMALNEVALQLRDRYKTDLLSTPLWAEFEKARNKFASSVATPPAQPAPVQEPVAWIWKYANGEEEVVFVPPRHVDASHVDAPLTITPLYTTPPAAPVQPVACIWEKDDGYKSLEWEGLEESEMQNVNVKSITPLYTTPTAQPAVPDAMTSADIQEHIEYVAGWNECRQAMLEMMK
jgi:hypothetical protein